jgi:hypothetical protein
MSQERKIAGRTVMALCAPELDPMAADVLEMLARLGARAGPPPDGARMRWAWSALTLVAQPDGTLLLHEPDFDHDPMLELRPILDTTLRVVRDQGMLCRRVGAAPQDCWYDSIVMAGPGALQASALRLVRVSPAGPSDSGWYLADAREADAPEDADLIAAYRAWELLRLLPSAIPALALPEGWSVMIESGRLTRIFDAAGLSVG